MTLLILWLIKMSVRTAGPWSFSQTQSLDTPDVVHHRLHAKYWFSWLISRFFGDVDNGGQTKQCFSPSVCLSLLRIPHPLFPDTAAFCWPFSLRTAVVSGGYLRLIFPSGVKSAVLAWTLLGVNSTWATTSDAPVYMPDDTWVHAFVWTSDKLCIGELPLNCARSFAREKNLIQLLYFNSNLKMGGSKEIDREIFADLVTCRSTFLIFRHLNIRTRWCVSVLSPFDNCKHVCFMFHHKLIQCFSVAFHVCSSASHHETFSNNSLF